MRKGLLMLVVAAAIPGCTTFKSTMFHRGEDNQHWYEGPVLKGIPTTLRVITHVRVDIVEHRYLTGKTEPTSDRKALGISAADPAINWLDNGAPRRSVVIIPIETEKIVTIDPKRPLSGTADKINFTFAGQQVDQLEYQVNDDTLEDITAIVTDLFPDGVIPEGTQPAADTTNSMDIPAEGHVLAKAMLQVDATVASTLLEIDDPNFEGNLRYFIDNQLNECHDCRFVLRR